MSNAKKVNAVKEVADAMQGKDAPTLMFQQSELYKTEKELLSALALMIKTTGETQKEIQKLALSAIVHIMQHGQIATIRKFYHEFPESMRKDALGAYFDKYAPVTFKNVVNEETGKSEVVISFSKEKRDLLLKSGWYVNAATKPWWKAAKQTEYKGYDFMESLMKFAMQAKRHAEKPKEGDKVSVQHVNALLQLVDGLHKQEQEAVAA